MSILNKFFKRRKDVYIEGGFKSCGKARNMVQACDLAWKFFPEDIKLQVGRGNINALETKTQFIVL